MITHPKSPRIVRSRRKTVSLIIERDGSLTVRAPLRLPSQQIEAILQEKADWIRKKQAWMLARLAESVPRQYVPGEQFWYLGQCYSLQVTAAEHAPLSLSEHFVLDKKYLHQAGRVFEAWYRSQARRVLAERLEAFASRMGLDYARLRLSSAKTRWGSCSSSGAISLAWRLVMAPLPVIDYVVVHELAHLRVKNHSKNFWAVVAATLPGYRAQIAWLKEHGHQLRL